MLDARRRCWTPPASSYICAHVSGQAGIRRAGRADSGAVAPGAGLAGGAAPLPERPPGHRPRGGAGGAGGVRGGEGASAATGSGIRWRRSTGGSRGSWAVLPGSGSPAMAGGTTPTGSTWSGCSWTGRRVRIRHVEDAFPLAPFGLISGADLRILFGYRMRRRFRYAYARVGQRNPRQTRGCVEQWLCPRLRTTRRRR